MSKYLLRLKKTSFLRMFRNLAMSLGSNKASSKNEATWHPIPPLKLLIDASSLRGSPLSMGARSQALASRGWLPPLSTLLCEVWVIFCCFAALWVSSSWVGQDLPVSTISFPFQISKIRLIWYKWLRRRKRRFGRRWRKLWLRGLPRCISSELRFYQVH